MAHSQGHGSYAPPKKPSVATYLASLIVDAPLTYAPKPLISRKPTIKPYAEAAEDLPLADACREFKHAGISASVIVFWVLLTPVTVVVGSVAAVCAILKIVLMLSVLGGSYVAAAITRVTRYKACSYSPLKDAPGEFRLLSIRPGSGDSVIECDMTVASWETDEYEALSYTWGGSPFVAMRVNGEHCTVDHKLYRAIYALRRPDRARVLWIDQLCINQMDNNEKARQVQCMRQIYQNAKSVVVWLGESNGGLGQAVQQTKDLVAKGSSTAVAPWPEPPTCLVRLYRNPWWGRVWIIQEVALAREIKVQSDDHTIEWDDVCQFVRSAEVKAYLEIPDEILYFIQYVDHFRDASKSDPELGMLGLVWQFRAQKATNLCDKVFALRGLIKSAAHEAQMPVRYDVSPREVYRAFVKEGIRRYGSLAPLALGDAFDVSSDYGHWYYGWADCGHRQQARTPFWSGGLLEPELPNLGQEYRAAGMTSPRTRTNLVDPEILAVKGFVYDTIKDLGPRYKQGSSDDEHRRVITKWQTLAGGPWSEEDGLEDTFRRTLTAGKWTSNTTPSWNDTEYQKYHNAACVGRRMVTTKGGLFGLANSKVEEGDAVCILLGSPVPFILRKSDHTGISLLHTDTHSMELRCSREAHLNCCISNLYILIGQMYLDEAMHWNGDLEQGLEDGKVHLEEFFLE